MSPNPVKQLPYEVRKRAHYNDGKIIKLSIGGSRTERSVVASLSTNERYLPFSMKYRQDIYGDISICV